MIVFDELRITNDLQYLIVRAHVRKMKPFENVRISSLTVYSHKQFCKNGSEEPEGGKVFGFKEKPKEIEVYIENTELNMINLDSDLIFVKITAEGYPDESNGCLCGMDKDRVIGVTMNMGNIYNKFMSYIKDLADTCNISKDLIDKILQWKTFTAALDGCHYCTAVDYYKKWFLNDKSVNTSKGCGCHG